MAAPILPLGAFPVRILGGPHDGAEQWIGAHLWGQPLNMPISHPAEYCTDDAGPKDQSLDIATYMPNLRDLREAEDGIPLQSIRYHYKANR